MVFTHNDAVTNQSHLYILSRNGLEMFQWCSLAERYNPIVGCFESWGAIDPKNHEFEVSGWFHSQPPSNVRYATELSCV